MNVNGAQATNALIQNGIRNQQQPKKPTAAPAPAPVKAPADSDGDNDGSTVRSQLNVKA